MIPVDELKKREIRIAPVMTGGTSLAVWMAGVTHELYSVLRHDQGGPGSTAEIYHTLLEVTGSVPVVDVITGTSAGGLNGAMLAAAISMGVSLDDFSSLKTLVMESADLERLLHHGPGDPPSLLNGKIFEDDVRDQLRLWEDRTHGRQTGEADLVTTYTMVHPLKRQWTDQFGETLGDQYYGDTLRFGQDELRTSAGLDKLAIAARTSAAIPGVFEPTFLRFDPSPGPTPDFSLNHRGASVPRGRWAVDGGVVLNFPLKPALDRIFLRNAEGLVQRVVLYVCPTPTADPVRRDRGTDHLTIRDSVSTVVSSSRAQTISDAMEEIEARRRATRQQQVTRLALVPMVEALRAPPSPSQADLFALFRQQRARTSVDQLIERRRHLRGVAEDSDDELREQLLRSRELLLVPDLGQLGAGGTSWGWGIAPLEDAASFALDLINSAWTLALRLDQRPDVTDERRRRQLAGLKRAKIEVHEAVGVARYVRWLDGRYWDKVLLDRAPTPTAPAPEGQAADDGRGLYRDWPSVNGKGTVELRDEEVSADRVLDALRAAHLQIATALAEHGRLAREIADEVAGSAVAGSICERAEGSTIGEAADRLRSKVRLALGERSLTSADADPDAEEVRQRLLALHMALTLVSPAALPREQPFELMQVSWHAACPVDPDRLPEHKVIGTELARLAAFVKRSWRANDRFWGRMDGASRLVRLLLDPCRLEELGRSVADVISELGLEDVEAALAGRPHRAPGSATPEELALERAIEAVVYAVQLRIAREELPVIVSEVRGTSRRRPDFHEFVQSPLLDRFADTPHQPQSLAGWTDEEVCRLVHDLRIGRMPIHDELDSEHVHDLLERVVRVAAQGLGGEHSGLGEHELLAEVGGSLGVPLVDAAKLVRRVLKVLVGPDTGHRTMP